MLGVISNLFLCAPKQEEEIPSVTKSGDEIMDPVKKVVIN